jgi:hypothetical protein
VVYYLGCKYVSFSELSAVCLKYMAVDRKLSKLLHDRLNIDESGDNSKIWVEYLFIIISSMIPMITQALVSIEYFLNMSY